MTLFGLSARAFAEEPSGQKLPGPEPLEFRRLFVPEGRVKEVIGDQKYASYESAKFERLVSELSLPSKERPPAVVATVATYEAQFNGQALVAGQAQLNLRRVSGDVATYSLQQCNLAIANPHWSERRDQVARLGTTAEGDKVLFVDESGTVSFNWSARGAVQSNGEVDFSLVLPHSTSSQLDLRVPKQWIPRSPVATVRELDENVAGSRTWRLVVNSASKVMVRMVRKDAGGSRRPAAVVTRKDLTYSFDKTLVRLLAELSFDVDHRPIGQMNLRLSAPLTVRMVRLGDSELTFATALTSSGGMVVTVEFPQPVYGIDRKLVVDAAMPPRLEQPWQLPSLIFEDTPWQEGSTFLELVAPLTLDHLTLRRCRQTSVKPLLDPPGSIVELQQLSDEASVTVVLGREPRRASYAGGSEIRLLDDELRATCILDLSTTAGEIFEFQGDVARPWNVDSVRAAVLESSDSPSLGARSAKIPLQWELRTDGDGNQTLAVSLGKSIRPGRVVRFRLQAHRPRPQLGALLSIEQMQVVTPRDVAKDQHLIGLYGQSPHRFELRSENEITWFDPAEAKQQQQALLPAEPGGLFFRSDARAHETIAILTQSASRFKAKLDVTTVVRQDSLDETFRLRCEPANMLGTVQVALTGSGDDEIRWSLEGGGGHGVAARKLPASRQLIGDVALDERTSVELWELTLARPRDEPFTVVGRRHRKTSDDVIASLAWMPKATSQEGTLLLKSGDGTPFEVEHSGLTPFPLPAAPPDRFTGDRAAYRYRPADLPVVRIIGRDAEQKTVSAWAWSCNLRSTFAEGRSLHSAIFRIENVGLEWISLKLPENAELRQVLVDGRPVNVAAIEDSRREFALPSGVRYPTVIVNFTDRECLPNIAGKCAAHFPEINIPVLRSYWTAWVPPSANCVAGDSRLAKSVPRALAKRLLGPLLRERDEKRFSPADLRSTWKDFVGRSDDGAVEMLRRAFDAFTAIQTNDATWSQLFQSYDELAAREGDEPLPPLFVDRVSLRRLAIAASARISASENETFEQTLDRSGLALLLIDRGVALVSQQWLSSQRSLIRASHSPLAWMSDNDAELGSTLSLVSAGRWLEAADSTPVLWQARDHSADSELFRAGWTAIEFEVDPDENFTVQLVRPSRILVLAWGAFFFAVGVGWWLTVKSRRFLFLTAMLTGTVAIVVPTHFSTVATACLLGLPVGALIGIVSGTVALVPAQGRELRIEESATTHLSTLSTVLLLAACVCYFLLAGAGLADDLLEDERAAPPAKRHRIYSVIIPIDKDKRPAEDTVYVPDELSFALLNLSANRNGSSQAWLLRAAEYDLQLNWQGVRTELVATELAATYNFDVSNISKKVKLPLSREQLHLIPDRALLNGEPVQVDWAGDGSGLTFDVGNTGSHVLELAFQPVAKLTEQVTRTSILIPQIHRSVLRVHFPDGAESITVANSLGAVTRDDETRNVTAALGPISQIVLHWPRNRGDDDPASRISASQISWLTVGEGSVVMRSKFRFSTDGSPLNQVAIKTDPRLQMRLEPDQPLKVVDATRIDDSITRVTTLRRIGPADSEISLDVTFSVPDTSGIGSILLPRVHAVADESVNRWLAISVGPQLQLSAELPDAADPIPAEDFLDEWGNREPDQAVPAATMLLREGERPIQFDVYPRPVEVQAEENLRVALARDSATVQYRAEIDASQGKVFRLQLRVPPNLRVAEIRLQAEGESIPANWKQTAKESVVVKADGPLPARATLSLLGETSIAQGKNVALPNVLLESVPVKNKRLEVYRRSSVDVEVQPEKAWREIESDRLGTLDRLLGRLAAVLEPATVDARARDRLPTAVVRENNPQPNYQLVSVARRVDGQWWAEIVCRLHGFQGVVDTIRLDIPSSWNEPIEAENGNVLRITAPGSDRSRLLVQPSSPLVDGAIVRLRGRLLGSPKEMPDIYVTDRHGKLIERFVALQIESANQRTDWQTAGLREAAWSEHLLQEVALPEEPHLLFRVVGQRYRARVENMGPVAGIPQVRLVDVHLYQAERNYFCVASFDIEPAGLQQCEFQLPYETRLLHVSVAGQPAVSSAGGNHRWRVRLAHEQLPQRIELLYAGRWPDLDHDSDGPLTLELPQVIGVPVERTLVTLSDGGRETRWELRGAEVAALRQERFRLRSMTTLIDLSRTVARDQISEDRRRWFVHWAQRMVAARRRIEGYRWRIAPEDKSLEVELSDIATSQLEAAEDLQTAGLLSDELRSTVVRPDLVRAEKACRLSLTGSSRTVAKGRLLEVELSPLATGETPLWQRLAAMALFPFACIALYFLCTRGPFREWIIQWLFVFGVVFGVFWWLLLTPSIVGWLIVAVSVIAALRSHGSRVSGTRRQLRRRTA